MEAQPPAAVAPVTADSHQHTPGEVLTQPGMEVDMIGLSIMPTEATVSDTVQAITTPGKWLWPLYLSRI